jgi:hypothetical protein
VLTSRPPRCREGFTVPGRPLAGGCAQDPGRPDGTEPTSFRVNRPASRRSVGSLLAGFNSSGSRCTTLQGENYTYSRVLGHVQPYSSCTLIS